MINRYYKFDSGYKPNKPLIIKNNEIDEMYYYGGYVIQFIKDSSGVRVFREEAYLGLYDDDREYKLKRAIHVIDKRIKEREKDREIKRKELINKFIKFVDRELM